MGFRRKEILPSVGSLDGSFVTLLISISGWETRLQVPEAPRVLRVEFRTTGAEKRRDWIIAELIPLTGSQRPHELQRQQAKQDGGLGASLVAQWLRVCLPMQGTRVRALVWEDPTCRGATRPVSHSY